MISTLLLAALAAAPAAKPVEPLSVKTAVVKPSAPAAKEKRFGLLLDAGVPDGAGLSLGYRPLKWLRLEAGLLGNGVGFGARGGVTFVPFQWVVRPTLTAQVGRYFEADAGWLLGDGADPHMKAALAHISYNFGNAHLGFELGSRRFAFYLRAGLSYMDMAVAGLAAAVPAAPDERFSASPVHLRLVTPSAKLGFVYFFL